MVIIFYKVLEWHACTCNTPEAIVKLFGFELLKLRFCRNNLFDDFLKKAILLACIIDKAGGMVSVTPEGMGHHILLSVKMTLNARINIF